MSWKETVNIITTIIGIGMAFYYGYHRYVKKENYHEWEEVGDAEKMVFYLVTSPIWLLVGIVELLGWIVEKISLSNNSTDKPVDKTPTEKVTPIPAPQNSSFLLIVDDVFEIQGRAVVSGTIANGKIFEGDLLIIVGVGEMRKAICAGIERNRQLVKSAAAGELVGLLLKGVNFHDLHVGQRIIK